MRYVRVPVDEGVAEGPGELSQGSEHPVVAGAIPRQQRVDRVVEIVSPLRVEPVSALFRRAKQARLLRFVLADHQRGTALSGPADLAHDRGDHVVVRGVEDLLRRVEA